MGGFSTLYDTDHLHAFTHSLTHSPGETRVPLAKKHGSHQNPSVLRRVDTLNHRLAQTQGISNRKLLSYGLLGNLLEFFFFFSFFLDESSAFVVFFPTKMMSEYFYILS